MLDFICWIRIQQTSQYSRNSQVRTKRISDNKTDECVPRTTNSENSIHEQTYVCQYTTTLYVDSSQISKDELTSDADPPTDISCKQIFCSKCIYLLQQGIWGKCLMLLLLHFSQAREIPRTLHCSFLLLWLLIC